MSVDRGAPLRISIRRVTRILAWTSALFAVLGVVTQMFSAGPGPYGHVLSESFAHWFDLDAEATLPAWFQSAMLLSCAALLWSIGRSLPKGVGFAGYWKGLAWVFLFVSADECVAIHEELGFWISDLLGGSMGVYAWLIPGLAAVALLGFASWKALRQLPPAIRRGMILAAIVYVSGAAGMELVEARLDALWGTLPFSMIAAVEETLEMAGLVIFIHTLLSYLRTLPQAQAITIDP